MKKLFLILIFPLTFVACAPDQYLLTDKGSDRNFLRDQIQKQSATGVITDKPILVIDGKPHRYDVELKDHPLQLAKADIENIQVLKLPKAIEIYGDAGRAGVLVITTKNGGSEEKSQNVLYFLDDKQISKAEMETLDPSKIESIDVLKDKDKVLKYTDKEVDGVIIIHTQSK
jgi:hypothetical protein